MIKVEKNANLLPFNTFRVDARARYLCYIERPDQFDELLQSPYYQREKRILLGGGSNVLFTGDFDGLVIKVDMKGIRKEQETEDTIRLKVYSGESWSHLVSHTVANNWGGLENLSLIPGAVGAAPIQNIGAYGVEVKDVIEEVETVELASGRVSCLTPAECRWGYRDSVFKHQLKDKVFIRSVTFRLTKKHHRFNVSYGAIQSTLAKKYAGRLTLQNISKAVIDIRRSKLPDPSVIGNAGSFFKNPILSAERYAALQRQGIEPPAYTVDEKRIKVAAGWLIEQCGWKGKKIGAVGVHARQALVLVNYGGGSGKDIAGLAEQIRRSVAQKFNIELVPEVTYI